MLLLPTPLVEYFTTDGPWPFFLTFHIQSVFGFCSLAINFVLILYAFCAGDCYNPHTSMWRSMLVVDILATAGFILDAESALKLQELSVSALPHFPSVDGSSQFVPSATTTTTTTTAAPLALDSSTVQSQAHPNPFKAGPPYTVYDIANGNFTVLGCTAQRPYLFLTLIARQWAALLVLFMGLERLLFVLYPLWLRSIRMNVAPLNVFIVFFALFSTGIAYTNATYVAAFEQTHFSCEATWAFGEDYGWFFFGIVIAPQALGCLFCIIAYFMVHHEHALRKFGGNRMKLASEKRKLRKIKWLLITSSSFVAFPQMLLLFLQLIAPQEMFLIKMLISQLFLAKCFGNILMYNRAIASTRFGFIELLKQWWDKRRKSRVNPTEAVNSVSFLVAQPQQQTTANP
ncbi:hypothetical protein niasHT_006105 [Heterodera trifolii]|uniref:G-protein coupled receptors family 1 profile domain-containing protein n=1 Tax=Heterodera trifolii TaxID=157864 RepID=A0ABD2M6E5_9BILA